MYQSATIPSFALALCLGAFLCPCLPAADYAVSALTGNDNNNGSLGQPFKTLSKASSVASSGDRIFVFPGRYGPTLGETFPITFSSGVKVLGVDGRTCIIDAEYDPTQTNNAVQGTIVKIGADCEFAWMSIINAPRDPSNPGNHWWKIALHIDDSGTSADNAWVHHCYLDEFSRGIFVGGPSGTHTFKNVRIENCVLTRFYVEAINSTAGGGAVSGNQVTNCTVVGHKNPNNNKPYGRACISFGNGTQFDVRNCIIKDGDWAGIEADPSATITSDYNCYHGSSANFRGVTKGSNDVETDPMLAALPDANQTVDPHQSGPRGPLFEKGTNIVTSGSDIDFGSIRLSGAFVDIGADEFTGTDTWFVGVPSIGSTIHVGMLGTASSSVVFALSLGSIGPVAIPGFKGRFELDLTQPNLIFAMATNANGFARLPAPIPNAPPLAGLQAFIQCLDVTSLTLSDLDKTTFVN